MYMTVMKNNVLSTYISLESKVIFDIIHLSSSNAIN